MRVTILEKRRWPKEGVGTPGFVVPEQRMNREDAWSEWLVEGANR